MKYLSINGIQCRFGEVKNGEMLLNEFDEIAHHEWEKLPERSPNFELDVFQIIPTICTVLSV